jgi:hypothetical protein
MGTNVFSLGVSIGRKSQDVALNINAHGHSSLMAEKWPRPLTSSRMDQEIQMESPAWYERMLHLCST